jgi:FkbH-like protein
VNGPRAAERAGLLAPRRRWAAFVREPVDSPAGAAPLAVGIAASYTAEALVPHLGAALLEAGFAPTLRLAAYNQIVQACADPEGALGTPLDCIVVLPRIEELAAAEMRAYLAGTPGAIDSARGAATALGAALRGLRDRFAGTIAVGSLPWPQLPEADALDLAGESARFVRAVEDAYESDVRSLRGVVRIDVAALQREFGARQAVDLRTWYLFRQPYSEAFFAEMGRLVGRALAATRRAARKCLVLDADNTLWGGILGEDGIGGVRLGDEFPGSAFSDLQRLALHWRRQGIFLAVVSKNNPEDVAEMFRNHDAMILREDDVSAFVVNWGPKSDAVAEVARRLNIGLESVVFVDDSAYEIAEVSERHPGVLCIQAPSAPEQLVATVRDARPFDRLEITADDRVRVDRMTTEAHRESLRAELPQADFVARLALSVDTFPVTEPSTVRVTQLINKTNQFNLTTPRLSIEEVRALATDDQVVFVAARVSDRFGEYGLTCVGCAKPVGNGESWSLDILLMSCRVLGRGVETTFLADIAARVADRGGRTIVARRIPTAKNGVCEDFLQRQGFAPTADGSWWRAAAAAPSGTCCV